MTVVKLVISGNPRFDLYRADYRGIFSDKAEKIRKVYGPFILVTTNFAFFNNYIGPERGHGANEGQRTCSGSRVGRGVLELRTFSESKSWPNLYRRRERWSHSAQRLSNYHPSAPSREPRPLGNDWPLSFRTCR